jgi:hypothetical protein
MSSDKSMVVPALAAVLLTMCASISCAQEVTQVTTETVTTTTTLPAADKQVMDPEMMAKMKAFSTPNENHRVLDQFVGSWDNTVKMWMGPDSGPQVSQGTSETRWILDGHFIEQDFKGEHMGQPFTGRWTIGYDNLKKEYVSVWVDSMSTGINSSSGTYDPATKTFTEQGSFSCPIENGPLAYRSKTRILDEDTYVHEMYMADKTGKDFKAMEITYNRKK